MRKNYDFTKAKRGAVLPAGTGKTRITIRIDDDVLEWFRKQVHAAGGGSYQAMMNRALRKHMEREAEPLEDKLRRVLREVLPESRTGSRSKPAKKKTSKKRGGK